MKQGRVVKIFQMLKNNLLLMHLRINRSKIWKAVINLKSRLLLGENGAEYRINEKEGKMI